MDQQNNNQQGNRGPSQNGPNQSLNIIFIIIIILFAMWGLVLFIGNRNTQDADPYTWGRLQADLEAGNVVEAQILPNRETPTGTVM